MSEQNRLELWILNFQPSKHWVNKRKAKKSDQGNTSIRETLHQSIHNYNYLLKQSCLILWILATTDTFSLILKYCFTYTIFMLQNSLTLLFSTSQVYLTHSLHYFKPLPLKAFLMFPTHYFPYNFLEDHVGRPQYILHKKKKKKSQILPEEKEINTYQAFIQIT